MTKRRQFSAKFKFQVALDALKGTQRVPETINEIASLNEVHPTQVKQWKKQLQDDGAEVFSEKASKEQEAQAEVEATLYEQIGRLKVELHPEGPRLKKKLPESAFAKCGLVEPAHPNLSIRRQCELLGLTRSSYYYEPAMETPLNLRLMALLDREYTDHPFYGRRKMTIYLRGQGYDVNPKRVRRLLKKMGVEAIYPKPRTTVVDRDHRVYPYLLRGVEITRPNQVWSTDITYIPMKNGFMYLTAVIDWYSRYVLAWQLWYYRCVGSERCNVHPQLTHRSYSVNGQTAYGLPAWKRTETNAMSTKPEQIPMRAVPGYYSSTPGIQIAIQTNADASDEDLQFFEQLGVEWAMVGIRNPEQHTLDFYKSMVKRFGDHGLKIYRVTNLGVHNVPEITLNLPGRDAKVEEFKQFIRNIGAAGIKYNTYAHMANGIWSSGRAEGRGGMDARRLDIKDAVGRWADKTYAGELTHGRLYSEEELWDNYTHLIREITPVAEEAGVFIGVHPDDPPVYALGGIPRCMFGNFAGYQKAMEIADSPNIGVCLCVGCWLEGGEIGMGVGVVDAIKHFGAKGQLFKVHFRNVSNPMPEPWVETLIDNGYQDMYQVMKALREVKFDGCIIPDHIPAMLGGARVGTAYSIAYMRALVQAVNNEFGGPA